MNEIYYSSIEEIHRLYKEKKLTVRSLVMAYLSRIAEIDKCKDGLNSVLETNPDVLFIADEFDERLKKGEEPRALFGIPVLLKDNVNTKDRLHTSAGSVALADNYAPYDAHIVKNLRQAGAVILGKANMTEFANFMTRENMPSGYSSRGGQVINPHKRDETPSGSSSGSGVATAAGLCTVSIGTETSGSIVSPAAYNGIVGIKPTMGLVGRSGIIPIASTLDTAGPMTRTVRDAAILLGAIAGHDPDDPATHTRDSAKVKDYLQCLDPNGLKGLSIGIDRFHETDESKLNEEGRNAFDNICKVLSNAGAVIKDNVNLDYSPSSIKIMRYEFKACMNYYLSTLSGNSSVKTLDGIIKFNQEHAAVALKYGQSLLLDCQNNTSGTMTETEYLQLLAEREKTIAAFDKIFDDNSIDVILCEGFPRIAPFTGFPSMSIPIGRRKDNLPIGSYWIARRFDEGILLKAAYAVEQLLGLNLQPIP